MPIRNGPKGLKATMPNLTPRQKVAIYWPCDRGRNSVHARYHRRTGGWQSILTLDLFPPPPHDKACPTRAKKITPDRNGLVALDCDCDPKPVERGEWHARTTTWPGAALADWSTDQKVGVKRVLKRLLRGVGKGEIEIRKGKETSEDVNGKQVPNPTSVHFYKEATASEIARCQRDRKDN